MNSYGDITTLVSETYINLDGNAEYTRLRRIMEGFSRLIDKETERKFYCWEGIYYFDGPSGKLWVNDLLSVSEMALDEDGDGTYEETLAATDYLLYPYNTYPKDEIKPAPNGNYGSFAVGVLKGIKITGVWGFGDGTTATPYAASGDTVQDDPLTAAATLVTITDGDYFSIGQTIRMESEQAYVQRIDLVGKQLHVRRGVNGTTAAQHAKNTAISIYEYPQAITQAVHLEAAKAWKRKDEGWATAIAGSPETGGPVATVGLKLDPFTLETIKRFKRYV